MNDKVVLSTEKEFEVRFSEVDMMGVVWHGAYPLYLEDAREEFGAQWGLSYQRYIKENIFVPIVEMSVNYKKPLRYGERPTIRIKYVPTDSAKIIFDYEIFNKESGDIHIKARTVQVFMDNSYNLLWYSPEFYTDWKKSVGLI